MSQKIITDLTNMIQEEQWTRSTLQNYSTTDFQQLHALWLETLEGLEAAEDETLRDEILELLDVQLSQNKHNVSARYIMAHLKMRKHAVDDTDFLQLAESFITAKRWGVVEAIAEQVLKYGDNRSILHLLAETYHHLEKQDEEIKTWEKIILIDFNEADMVLKLAKHREAKGDIYQAITLYQKALSRFLKKEQFNSIQDIWFKLVELEGDNTEYFLMQDQKISKFAPSDKVLELLERLYQHLVAAENWNGALKVVKRQLEIAPKDLKLRKNLVEIYRTIYASKPNLEDIIKNANLLQSFQNIQDAIAMFEKYISFAQGSFAYHKTWGVGRISEIDDTDVVVDFGKKRGHKMTLKMAVEALVALPNDHLWVYKSVMPKDKLKAKIQKNHAGALKIIIGSFPEKGIDVKSIKQELVPSVLTTNEWNVWSPIARKTLKTNAMFGNLEDFPDRYVLREKPVTFEEKIYNKFKNTQDYFVKVALFRELIAEAGIDSDHFNEMFKYFCGYLNIDHINELTIASYLVIDHIQEQYSTETVALPDFKELYEILEDPLECFEKLSDNELKELFLKKIRWCIEDWDSFYVRVFPSFHTTTLITTLKENDKKEALKIIVTNAVDRYKELREAFIWLAPHAVNSDLLDYVSIDKSRVYINALNLYEITSKEISNRRSMSINKRLNKLLKNFLFKDDTITKVILEADKDDLVRLYSLVIAIDFIEDKYKNDLEAQIMELHPKMKIKAAMGSKPKAQIDGHAQVSNELLALESSFIAKQKELKKLSEELIPANSQEIAVARELGDLKENAEYIAAKEHQRDLLKKQETLQTEITIAKIVDLAHVDNKKVSFGNHVVLEDLIQGVETELTILGPWESEPSKKIISYLSPLGTYLMGASLKKDLNFTIGEKEFSYKIKEINVITV